MFVTQEQVNIRKSILRMTHYSKASHIGSCLSIVDILYVLYFRLLNIDPLKPLKEDRDRFILSKGHASAALYATLAERGFFPKEYLEKFYINNGILPGHVDMKAVPGIEISTGSLGHGLAIGLGMAIANLQANNPGKIYVLLGDGECNEGLVWEAIMLAASLKVANLIAIIDYNKFQGFGQTNKIIDQSNMVQRWQAFNWDALEIDGHNLSEVEDSLKFETERPKVIVAHTIKGKGISFMENKLEWHYKSPNEIEFNQAIQELEGLL